MWLRTTLGARQSAVDTHRAAAQFVFQLPQNRRLNRQLTARCSVGLSTVVAVYIARC